MILLDLIKTHVDTTLAGAEADVRREAYDTMVRVVCALQQEDRSAAMSLASERRSASDPVHLEALNEISAHQAIRIAVEIPALFTSLQERTNGPYLAVGLTLSPGSKLSKAWARTGSEEISDRFPFS